MIKTETVAERSERREWQRYRVRGDVEARNRLVERHIGLVYHFARRLESQGSGVLELEDLVSAGTVGLLSAVTAYDPSRGYRFSTFAAPRIRGAMLDELRRRDVAPRSVRRRERAMVEATERLTVDLNRQPRPPELAGVLGVDVKTLWRWKWDVARSQRVSLTELLSTGAGPVASESVDSVEARLTLEAEVCRLRRELVGLSERERLVIELYDLRSLTLREIAERLGVTESRVSQIRTRALGRLRERMKDMREAA